MNVNIEKAKTSVTFHEATGKLTDSLYKRQSERLELEKQLGELSTSNRQVIRMKAAALYKNWQRFVEQDKISRARNERLLQELNRIDIQAAILASRSEQLRLLKERYQLHLDRSRNASLHQLNLVNDGTTPMQPVHHSTPKKISCQEKDQNADQNEASSFSHSTTSSSPPYERNPQHSVTEVVVRTPDAQTILPTPTPPPRTKRNQSKHHETETILKSPESSPSSQEVPSPKITLRSSSIIRNKFYDDQRSTVDQQRPDNHLLTIQRDASDQLEHDFGAISNEQQTSSPPSRTSLRTDVNSVRKVPIDNAVIAAPTSDEVKSSDESGLSDSVVSTRSASVPKISAHGSDHVHVPGSSSTLSGKKDTLDDLLVSSKVSLSSPNENIASAILSGTLSSDSSSGSIVDRDTTSELTGSARDDNQSIQNVKVTAENEAITEDVKRSPLKSPDTYRSVIDEVDDDLEDELAAVLSGHTSISERRTLNLSHSDDDEVDVVKKPKREVVDDRRTTNEPATGIQVKTQPNKKEVKKSTKWSMGGDSDSDVSFGNSTSIPGIDGDKDDFDFYD